MGGSKSDMNMITITIDLTEHNYSLQGPADAQGETLKALSPEAIYWLPIPERGESSIECLRQLVHHASVPGQR